MSAKHLQFLIALADETRAEIAKHLCCEWLSVNEIVGKLDGRVNQPTVSHHLKKLEEAGLVKVRQEGKFRFYTLDQEQVSFCCGQLMLNFAPDLSNKVIPLSSIPQKEE